MQLAWLVYMSHCNLYRIWIYLTHCVNILPPIMMFFDRDGMKSHLNHWFWNEVSSYFSYFVEIIYIIVVINFSYLPSTLTLPTKLCQQKDFLRVPRNTCMSKCGDIRTTEVNKHGKFEDGYFCHLLYTFRYQTHGRRIQSSFNGYL